MAKRADDAVARFSLRLPEQLRARLETEARRLGVSLNAEMVLALESHLYQKQIGQTIFGSENIYTVVSVIGHAIACIEKNYGKKLEDDIKNILQTVFDLIIRFLEKGREAIGTGEYPGGIRDATDEAVFAMLVRPLIDTLSQSPEALEALARQSQKIEKEVR
jgi:hypothetical protein